MINLANQLFFTENAIHKLIETIIEEYECCKQIIKEHFNKSLVMFVKDEEKI